MGNDKKLIEFKPLSERINKNQLEILTRKGWPDKDIASFFGITGDILSRWRIKHPEISKQSADWKRAADEKVVRSMYEVACGYSHPEDKIFYNSAQDKVTVVPTIKHYPPNTTAIIFWLCNRHPGDWKRARQDGEDPLSKMLYDLLKSQKNGKIKDKSKDKDSIPQAHQRGLSIVN